LAKGAKFIFQIKWLFNDSLLGSNFQNPRTAENRKIFGAENFFSEKSERIIVVEDLDKGNSWGRSVLGSFGDKELNLDVNATAFIILFVI